MFLQMALYSLSKSHNLYIMVSISEIRLLHNIQTKKVPSFPCHFQETMTEVKHISDSIGEYIEQDFTWARLPAAIKGLCGNSRDTWNRLVEEHALRRQLRWSNSVVRRIVLDEKKYYQALLNRSRKDLMLFPYHLSDVVIRGLRNNPFKFYVDLLLDVMNSEKSYDTLPNFTAADCKRLLGIGRNEYIDIMNKWRAKGIALFRKRKGVSRDLLPSIPISVQPEHWWIVRVGFVTENDIASCNEAEHKLIDLLIDRGGLLCGALDYDSLISLYKKGLVYIDVPVISSDRFTVPPLENFVMNRVAGDYMETTLYKILVSFDERCTVQQLAHILGMDISLVKNAISILSRLGFINKKISSKTISSITWHKSWQGRIIADGEGGEVVGSSRSLSVTTPLKKRIGFLFDSTLTAFLMMGNLSQGLKNHAVTMFEAGKLPDEGLESFITELEKVQRVGEGEGEAQRYFEHAVVLFETLRFLRRNPDCTVFESDGGLDMLRAESMNSLEQGTRTRLLRHKYSLLISVAPVPADSMSTISTIPIHHGPPIPEVNFPWFRLFLYSSLKCGPPCVLFARGSRIRSVPSLFADYSLFLVCTWGKEPSIVKGASLLQVINDVLVSTPAVVQAYVHNNDVFDVALPLFGDDVKEKITIPESPRQVGIMVQNSFDLAYSIGFVKVIRIKIGKHIRFVPSELHFGMPLFNSSTNTSVREAIIRNDLFSENSLKKHSIASRWLCLRILDFIREWKERDEIDNDLGVAVPMPDVGLVFDGSQLWSI